ncbi:MAG: hypothetical protein A2V67_01755 [Deltaproteobacteria bacterium RBG_13_61_14]|nr:MAG: hypothetical protein A2V67_01755 [Deltaproteobacteria bacterium RBG_13_61_14]
MKVARNLFLAVALVLALAAAGWTLGRAGSREPTPRLASARSQPAPAGYSCFLENTCPPCPGKPIARSQKKEKHGDCSCHQVTYQCTDGSTQTCWDNCE